MSPNLKGTTLENGKVLVKDAISEGGMSTVYKGYDMSMDPPESVAIKFLHGGRHSDEVIEESFRREVESLERLRDKNIVRVKSHGYCESSMYL